MSKLLFLTGIIEDGSVRDPVLPRSTATTVHVTVGEDVLLRMRLFYASGVAARLADFPGWGAQLTVNCTVNPYARIPDFHFAGVVADVSDGLGNAVDFAIPSATFRGASPGRYYFDVYFRTATERYEVVSPGALLLEPAMARP